LPFSRRSAAAPRAVFLVAPLLLAVVALSACRDDSTSKRLGAAGSTQNNAPAISGRPPATASAGTPYVFVPTATDADNDPLTFTISGKPSWMTFSSSTGQLYGVPGSSAIGRYDGIQIRVSDGVNVASLPAFSISVAAATATGSAKLRWVAPTQTTSGQPLYGLAGFRIYYGRLEPRTEQMLQIGNAAATQATIGNLGPGTWYFSIAAYTRDGVESVRSNAVLKSI
jgi:hypothetical protein